MSKITRIFCIAALSLIFLTGCRTDNPILTPTVVQATSLPATPTKSPTPTTEPPRALTVCMGQEPNSLFLYNDGSAAARNIRQAIYDGPVDQLDYQYEPVILERIPSLANQDVQIETVTVTAGDVVVDAQGGLVTLAQDTAYFPAGCRDAGCIQTYSGQGDIQLDQMSVRFRLLPGLLWSDGAQLTADDSVYSFEIAHHYYPRVRANLLARTKSYQATDPLTLEWSGLPGYLDPDYAGFFFTPLPRHAWSMFPVQELLTSEPVNRAPLGWGPYVIDEWVAGDHISLSRNPNYFRLNEGLPKFDHLVYRFIPDGEQALAALQAGECDYVGETARLETRRDQVLALEQAGKLKSATSNATAWEHLDFGIQGYQDPTSSQALPVPWFSSRETRQAVAHCIDRQAIIAALAPGETQIPDSYIPADHPQYATGVETYRYDPAAAANLLDSVGWLDEDGNPNTPRVARGIAGIQDGTPLAPSLTIADDAEKQQLAGLL